jgi:GNAT superfamily N-acetyltransferase
MAFGSTLAVEQAFSDAVWRERAIGASTGCDRATFIAERDRHWLGLVTCLARQDGLEHAAPLLISMFVDNTVRRAGVGIRLIEAVSAWAQACGAARLSLWVTSGNAPAVALYQRCGFRAAGATRPLAHTPTLAECEMVRELR